MKWFEHIRIELEAIYGVRKGAEAAERIMALVDRRRVKDSGRRAMTQQDIILITYGDSLRREGQRPLAVLKDFADRYLQEYFSTIHVLPFFPYSSDDGFAVSDFLAVNPLLGGWQDIKDLGDGFGLMFDFVLNHISAQSDWVARYLSSEPGFHELAIEVAPGTDLSRVVRPRTLPLLTRFTKASGEPVWLWTTFSADQIDLNFGSIDVLVKMVEVLLTYVEQGAGLLRLDAVAYVWKEIGTQCIHLPQTHALVRLLRCILDQVAPEVSIVTETNVPHDENISYFGDGGNEAQMVYNFTLPPLLMHAFLRGDASELTRWAQTLRPLSTQTTFFNFTASHDGIGVRPLEGILPQAEIDWLLQAAIDRGGQVSFGQDRTGGTIPYELNITYVDAIQGSEPGGSAMHARRFLASQAIALALPGVPGVYIHSLLGSRNWSDGVRSTGRARTINRRTLSPSDIAEAVSRDKHFRALIFEGYCQLLKARRLQAALAPHAPSTVTALDRRVFAIRRGGKGQVLYALTNLSPDTVVLNLGADEARPIMQDVLSRQLFKSESVTLQAYQYVWLTEPK
jgi:glucosylglycerate phosphorylase